MTPEGWAGGKGENKRKCEGENSVSCCVTLGNVLALSGPQTPLLQNGAFAVGLKAEYHSLFQFQH